MRSITIKVNKCGLAFIFCMAGIYLYQGSLYAQSDSSIWELKVREVIKQTANKQPTLTGGAVTTTIATFGTSMLVMAFEVTAKKEKDLTRKQFLDSVIVNLRSSADSLALFADEDVKVFHHLLAVLKLPRNNNEEKRFRDSVYYIALVEATQLPIKTAKFINHILRTTAAATSLCHSQIISDLGAGALVLRSSLDGILLIAEGNIQMLNPNDKEIFERERKKLLKEGGDSEKKIKEAVRILMKIED